MAHMRARSLRRGLALASIISIAGLVAACTPSGPVTAPAVPKGNFQFHTLKTVVNSRNDNGVCVFGVGDCGDEPSIINVGFSVRMGVPNSATASAVVGEDPNGGLLTQGPGAGGTQNFVDAQQASVFFPNVPLLDVSDLAWTTNHLMVVGVWSWKIENDQVGVGSIADLAANAIKSALNSTLAMKSLPSDASQIATSIVGSLTSNIGGTLLGALNFLEANIPVLNILSDDSMGSSMWIGLGVRGTLATTINFVTANAGLPNPLLVLDGFPILGNVKTPPDIGNSKIFALGTSSGDLVDSSTNPGVSGTHTSTSRLDKI
jgi:hypothetical protein